MIVSEDLKGPWFTFGGQFDNLLASVRQQPTLAFKHSPANVKILSHDMIRRCKLIVYGLSAVLLSKCNRLHITSNLHYKVIYYITVVPSA